MLRRILERHVPPTLTDRPKQGFSAPVGRWLRGSLRPWAEDLLGTASLAADGTLHAAPVRQVWAAHLRGREDHGSTLWPILMYLAWRQAPTGQGIAEPHA